MERAPYRLALLILLLAVTVSPAIPGDDPQGGNARFDFAMIGDLPYGTGENSAADEAKFDNLINDVNADNKLQWVIHVGDIKNGSSVTSNAKVIARFNQYQKFQAPFLYTPGDNEWTDAHRVNNGSFLPTERLAFVRSIFYPNPGWSTGGRLMKVQTQASDPGFSEYGENQMWMRSSVVFSAIHVVGSNNDLAPWSGIDPADSFAVPRPDRLAEYTNRLAAVLQWIDQTF